MRVYTQVRFWIGKYHLLWNVQKYLDEILMNKDKYYQNSNKVRKTLIDWLIENLHAKWWFLVLHDLLNSKKIQQLSKPCESSLLN